MPLSKPKTLTVKRPLQAAMRDNSFYSSHGIARRYHIVTEEGFSACGRVAVQDDNAFDASTIPDYQRCQSNGCKQHWPASKKE